MRIFKPSYIDRHGKKCRTSSWSVGFQDHTSASRRITGFTDLAATEALGRKIGTLVSLRAVGEPLTPQLAKWIDGLADRLLAKFVEYGLVDARAALGMRPLPEHLETWHDSILADGRTKAHADLVWSRAAKVIAGVGAVRFSDIDELTVQGCNAANTRRVQTRNHYTRWIKQLAAWMVRMRRASVSPVAGLKVISAEADRKHVRRALSVGELQKPLKAALIATAPGLVELKFLRHGTSPPVVVSDYRNPSRHKTSSACKSRLRDALLLRSRITGVWN